MKRNETLNATTDTVAARCTMNFEQHNYSITVSKKKETSAWETVLPCRPV